MEDLNTYNDDTVHDMWVDHDYHINTGDLSDIFPDDEFDDDDELCDDDFSDD